MEEACDWKCVNGFDDTTAGSGTERSGQESKEAFDAPIVASYLFPIASIYVHCPNARR